MATKQQQLLPAAFRPQYVADSGRAKEITAAKAKFLGRYETLLCGRAYRVHKNV